MKKLVFLVSLLILTACQQGSESLVSTIETTENTATTQTGEGVVWYGNNDLGYFTSEIELADFTDVTNNPDVANTQQWIDLETMSILSLTSFPKSDFTTMLKENPEEWEGFSEIEILLGTVLETYLEREDAVVRVNSGTFNGIFYESHSAWIDLMLDDAPVELITVVFQPTETSERLYLISSEGTQSESVQDLLVTALFTWTLTK